MKLEKLNSKKFKTLENKELIKIVGGARRTRVYTKLLRIWDHIRDL